ncbi:hypothetical protein SBA3_3010018 [Candidatus Sulfopaludibacter sp. SbA3]|nr:hypothetical protein SBA3_3010018 [Candidatus Sulfopaludibacter sp. SbA3]
MFQTLLAERFKLAAHQETRDVPAYELVVAKGGLKIHTADAPAGGFQARFDGPVRHMKSQTTMTALATYLSDQLGMPVVNKTELPGTFDIALDSEGSGAGGWTPAERPAPPPGSGVATGAAAGAEKGAHADCSCRSRGENSHRKLRRSP